MENEQLQKMLSTGVAFHHASLGASDRKAVELGFLEGDISVICSTSTLAVGVNLPCYMVILKGTQTYTDTGLQEYSSLEVMQMLGRAGRPQFETEACAVILCLNERRAKYEKMVAGEEVLESSLHRNLIEHLNAEIGIGTISSLATAKQWLGSTFLNVRLQRNPKFYKLDLEETGATADDKLSKLCENGLHLLHEANMIDDAGILRCTEYGDAMARYCIKFDTMKTFMEAPAKAKTSVVLSTLSQAAELHDFRLKSNERSILKELNQSNEMRYPIQVNIDLPQHKASLLIQARLGSIQIGRHNKNKVSAGQIRQMEMDTNSVIGHSKRLIRCMVDIFVHRKDSFAAKSALELARSLAAGVWDDTVMQLKQIPGIGDVSVRKLAAAGIKSIDAVFNSEPHRLELVLSKNPPYGHELLKKLAEFPMLHITAKESDRKLKPEKGAEVKLHCQIGFLNDTVPMRYGRTQYSVLFLCETSYGELVDFRRFGPLRLKNKEDILLTALIDQPDSKLRCHVMCDNIVGTHKFAEVEVNCPAAWFPQKEMTHEVSFQRPKLNFHAPASKREEFDEDLDDSDLLAAVAHESMPANENIEVVEDIDAIMEELENEEKKKKSSRKRSISSGTGAQEFKEPQQLPNGKWTCRHTCVDRGKECKHTCCKEGTVTRPTNPATKRQKKDQALDRQCPTKKPKKDKSSGRHANQETVVDRLLPKARLRDNQETGEARTRKARLEPPSSTSRGRGTLTKEHTATKHIITSSLEGSTNLQPAVCDAFESGEYDWEAMDGIAAMFDELADPTQTSCGVSTGALRHHGFPSLNQHQVVDEKPADTGNDSGMPEKGLFMTASSSPIKRGDTYGFQQELDFIPPSDALVVNSIYQNPDPGRQLDNASSFRSSASTLLSSSAQLMAHAQDRCNRPSIADTVVSNDYLPCEAEQELSQRRYDEDQKRRWAELDDDYLNYENFGKWFKIVDDSPEEMAGRNIE